MSGDSVKVVMVVDDGPENISVIKSLLEKDYTVRPVVNSKAAMRAALVRPMPDLILLDVMMPELDGYAVCRQLKEHEATRAIPVIFITAKSEEADELHGLGLGAVDYITKPFSPAVVSARIRTHLALSEAKRIVDEHNQHLLDEREMIESMIVKMRRADLFDTRHVRHLIAPVEMTTGDVLLSAFAPDGRQMIFLGDFTGHGVTAAIGGPLVTYMFHQLVNRGKHGGRILSEINHQLYLRMPTGVFCAAILLEVNARRDHAVLWNAALPDALLVRGNRIHDHLRSHQLLPLGIIEHQDGERAAQGIPLEPGDRLYLYSDGLIEAEDPQENPFGMERLEAFILGLNADEVALEDLLMVLDRHLRHAAPQDDVTFIELSV
ncbi:MAG: fused response regulator/phosphatase [Magnetococcales bacterium]|nr:fused response regulator/phosphatase [Magnetococcales bacterium]